MTAIEEYITNKVDDNKNEVIQNYYANYNNIGNIFVSELENVEKEIFAKWQLEDGFYMNYEDGEFEYSAIIPIINKNITNKIYSATNMEEINKKEIVEKCKKELIKQYNKEMDNYGKLYGLSNKKISNIKKEIPKLVDKYITKATNKLFSNVVSDKLENLCNKFEIAYNKENYTQLEKITKNILKYLDKDSTIYRNDELFKKLRINVTKEQMVQAKLKNGDTGKLTEQEEELILNFDDEQMKILNKTLIKNKPLNDTDIDFAHFDWETDKFEEMFSK